MNFYDGSKSAIMRAPTEPFDRLELRLQCRRNWMFIRTKLTDSSGVLRFYIRKYATSDLAI